MGSGSAKDSVTATVMDSDLPTDSGLAKRSVMVTDSPTGSGLAKRSDSVKDSAKDSATVTGLGRHLPRVS